MHQASVGARGVRRINAITSNLKHFRFSAANRFIRWLRPQVSASEFYACLDLGLVLPHYSRLNKYSYCFTCESENTCITVLQSSIDSTSSSSRRSKKCSNIIDCSAVFVSCTTRHTIDVVSKIGVNCSRTMGIRKFQAPNTKLLR